MAPGSTSIRPTVAMALRGPTQALDRGDRLAGADQGVLPACVRRAARVPRLPDHREPEAPRPGDRGDVAEGGVGRLEERPLLDVRLEVADQLPGRAGRVLDQRGVEPEVLEGLVEGGPVPVAQVPRVVVPEPRRRLAAEQRRAEAGALLVAEADDLERERELGHPVDGTVDEPVRDGDRHHDAEHAVVAAGVGHGVEVGAEHQGGQPGLAALAAAPLVAGGVLPGPQPRLAHPVLDAERWPGVLGER